MKTTLALRPPDQVDAITTSELRLIDSRISLAVRQKRLTAAFQVIFARPSSAPLERRTVECGYPLARVDKYWQDSSTYLDGEAQAFLSRMSGVLFLAVSTQHPVLQP